MVADVNLAQPRAIACLSARRANHSTCVNAECTEVEQTAARLSRGVLFNTQNYTHRKPAKGPQKERGFANYLSKRSGGIRAFVNTSQGQNASLVRAQFKTFFDTRSLTLQMYTECSAYHCPGGQAHH